VVADSGGGVLDWDLRAAALAALDLDRAAARRRAEQFPWEKSAAAFVSKLTSSLNETETTPSYLRNAGPMARAREEKA